DRERFTRLRGLTAELLSEVDERPVVELAELFAADDRLRTPLLGVAVVLNDQRRGLLVGKDSGTGVYGAPCAFVDPGSDPETAVAELAARLIPDAQVLPVPHGICDSVSAGLPMAHTYYLTYVVDLTFVAAGDVAVDLLPAAEVDESELDELTRYLMDGADRTVLDAPLTLPPRTRGIIARIGELAKEGLAATEDSYNVARWGRIVDTADAVLAGVETESPLRPGRFAALSDCTPMTGAEALILDGEGRILLMRRSDTGSWAMPGGACEVGESSAATAVREVREELGVDIDIDGLAGVYGNVALGVPDPGEWVLFVYVATLAPSSDKPRTTAEALEWAWYHPEEIGDLDMFKAHGTKISRALQVLNG
ncbi:MAG: NUDIX domain-containing protein, partial [Stackebrandtia sp.]